VLRLYEEQYSKMIIIQDKLLSDDIFEVQFLCNLNACKGACCWEGEFGAPLEAEERITLENIYKEIKPFLNPLGIEKIEATGKYLYYDEMEEYGTPLLSNGACVYMTSKDGKAKCGIEAAHEAGITNFKKPISCHLYPIRVSTNEAGTFEALNYDKWDICKAACQLGKEEQLPMYRFLKDALIRKYGVDFYEEMENLGKYLERNKKSKGDK